MKEYYNALTVLTILRLENLLAANNESIEKVLISGLRRLKKAYYVDRDFETIDKIVKLASNLEIKPKGYIASFL